MAQDAFRRQITRRAATKEATTNVIFDMVDEEGEPVGSDTFHFSRPSEEQLFLMAAGVGGEDASASSEAAAVMALLKQTLPLEEYRRLRDRLAEPEDGLDMAVLTDTVRDLIGVWSDFPTKPQSASPGLPESSGVRSTGRVPGPGSTRSPSLSPAS